MTVWQIIASQLPPRKRRPRHRAPSGAMTFVPSPMGRREDLSDLLKLVDPMTSLPPLTPILGDWFRLENRNPKPETLP
jgi:hypothetical protein